MRTGLIAQKLGMTRVFAESGEHIPVTVLKLDGCQVVAVRKQDTDGYDAVQLGVGAAKAKNLGKAQRGHFGKAKVEPKRKLIEFRVSDDAMLNVGDELTAEHFVTGQYVDVALHERRLGRLSGGAGEHSGEQRRSEEGGKEDSAHGSVAARSRRLAPRRAPAYSFCQGLQG